ncbi:hypothetical protein EVAR_4650_1 [Eumeta japonica]|uniref:Uncharacterized protein n=1 Tax=Eumeta variegata TaxID=151549 RepID=A0A4C1Y9T0_EUMVA|nr:hypothetical protein EVAR_4650_1 [Eumeta japonica]
MLVQLPALTMRTSHLQESEEQRLPGQLVDHKFRYSSDYQRKSSTKIYNIHFSLHGASSGNCGSIFRRAAAGLTNHKL